MHKNTSSKEQLKKMNLEIWMAVCQPQLFYIQQGLLLILGCAWSVTLLPTVFYTISWKPVVQPGTHSKTSLQQISDWTCHTPGMTKHMTGQRFLWKQIRLLHCFLWGGAGVQLHLNPLNNQGPKVLSTWITNLVPPCLKFI